MDSSNKDVMTTGDVEDQQQDPKWFVDQRRILCSNQEREENKLGFFILKVPNYNRQPIQAFFPQGWWFGLHNRENLDNRGSEALKLDVAIQYGLVGEQWDRFCDAVVEDPKAMLACYGLEKGVTNWTDKQIKHILALDALFLAFYIDYDLPINESQLWVPDIFESLFNENDVFSVRWNSFINIVQIDLRRVENQIPLALIDKAVYNVRKFCISPTSGDGNTLIVDSQNQQTQYQQRSVESVVESSSFCFMDTSNKAFKIDNLGSSSEKTHILGATYKTICGSKGLLMKSEPGNKYIHVPSATKLKQASIKIVGVEGPLCTMSYTKKCLFLPKMKIFDATFAFIRNMAWYECKSTSQGCLFHDYILSMSDLIQAPEDLNLLFAHGVIYNACGIKGFEMWIALKEGLIEISSSQIHHDMKKAIETRCKHRRYKLWSEFKILFCSRPWLVLSTIAVVLVLMATLVQTYTAITGTNRMKPKFP